MLNQDNILREKTYKGQVNDLAQRIYYTLMNDREEEEFLDITTHRTAKTLSLLMKTLNDKGDLAETEIDQILLDLVP